MKFSQSAEYALRAIFHLAQDPGHPRTVQSLAEEAHIPVNYLSKLMQGLRRAGLVQARRGARGGFQLAKVPTQISLLEVVRVVDPAIGPFVCPANKEEHREQLCPLHQRLETCRSKVEDILELTTIGELVAELEETDQDDTTELCPIQNGIRETIGLQAESA